MTGDWWDRWQKAKDEAAQYRCVKCGHRVSIHWLDNDETADAFMFRWYCGPCARTGIASVAHRETEEAGVPVWLKGQAQTKALRVALTKD